MFTKKYDTLIIGCGLFGATCARQLAEKGQKVLIIEKEKFVGGMASTKIMENIVIHGQGPHYFHTNSKRIWDFVNKFGKFNNYKAIVMADYKGTLYSLPFNMFTFLKLWGCKTPTEARAKINEQIIKCDNPKNLEEWVLSKVGKDIYEIFIKGYTTKQWGCVPKKLPISIVKKIPLRFTYDTCYHNNAKYSGVPIEGYTKLIENIIDGVDIKLDTNFSDIKRWEKLANKLIFTGSIDEFFNYKYGHLEYRTLSFKHTIAEGDFQGVGQINYTDQLVPYTRIVEHKHFYENPEEKKKSVITLEYPETWNEKNPYYPIHNEQNINLYKKYEEEAKKWPNVFFGGRLGKYQYLDMDQVVAMAIDI